jgi:1-acyl-sn-glycerol-3-phosphate acyltransferase
VPGLGMLAIKVGAVQAHPANLSRLLYDEGELVLVFPEGRRGASKPLKERYRMRWFDAGFVQTALRARVPIVPLALVGAEESMPAFARINPLRRIVRLPSVALAPVVPLPAKFKIRFLEPVATDGFGEAAWKDARLVQALVHEIRSLIQENLFEMVAGRRSVWLG